MRPSPAVGEAAFRGSSWMIVNGIVTRLMGLAAIILLGVWLTPEDFGVYSIAMSMSAVTVLLREGGVRQYLVREHRRHDELVGPVFYMALAFNLLTAGLLVAMTRVSFLWTDDPSQASDIAMLLYVVALSAPLGTPGAILQARLMGELRFGAVSAIGGISMLIRYGLAILLAWRFGSELGAMAIVATLPVCAVFEWVAFARINRERLWSRRPQVSTWWTLLSHTKWILLGSFAIVLMNSGPNLAISAASRDAELVGVYFMAFNIIIQVGILLSANIGAVLFPAFAKLVDEPKRLDTAILKAIRQMMLVAAPMSLGLAVTFAPLESLVWHGKWESAAAAVRVLGYTYPFTAMLAVPLAAQQAFGQFRQWAIGLLGVGAVSVAAAAVGGHLFQGRPDAAESIAWCTGLSSAAVGLAWTLIITGRRGISTRGTLAAALAAWTFAMAAAIPVLVADGGAVSGLAALPRLVVAGGLFTALYLALVRVFLPGHLAEGLAMAPSRVRPFFRRALRLREAAA